MPDDGTAAEAWTLTPADHALVMIKNSGNRLGFAVLLLFYRAYGRFPERAMEIDAEALARVARQLGVEPDHHGEYDTTGRTWRARPRICGDRYLQFRPRGVS